MTSTFRRAILRLAAMALPVWVVACIGGVDNPPEAQKIIPLGTGTTSSGGAGTNAVGLYKLLSFNGHALPDTVVNDSAPTNPDSTRIVVAILDSAELQLDSDSTVIEKDYFQLARDVRGGAGLTPAVPNFNLTNSVVTDSVVCTGGTYIDTSAAQTQFNISLQQCFTFGFDFPRLANAYQIAGDSLTSSIYYQYFDSAATLNWPPYEAQVNVTWKFFSAPVITAQRPTAEPQGSIRKGTIRKGRRIVLN